MQIYTEAQPVDRALVMVVGKSRVTSVVVSKIVERCGLRCISAFPEDTWKALKNSLPALMILDGGAENADCAELMSVLAEMRGRAAKPAVILLTTRNYANVEAHHASIIDAVVPKPILPESLQPVIQRFVDAA